MNENSAFACVSRRSADAIVCTDEDAKARNSGSSACPNVARHPVSGLREVIAVCGRPAFDGVTRRHGEPYGSADPLALQRLGTCR